MCGCEAGWFLISRRIIDPAFSQQRNILVHISGNSRRMKQKLSNTDAVTTGALLFCRRSPLPAGLFAMHTVRHPHVTFQTPCFETQLTPNYKSKSNYLDSHHECKIAVWCLFMKNNPHQENSLLRMLRALWLICSNNNSHIPSGSSRCSFLPVPLEANVQLGFWCLSSEGCTSLGSLHMREEGRGKKEPKNPKQWHFKTQV